MRNNFRHRQLLTINGPSVGLQHFLQKYTNASTSILSRVYTPCARIRAHTPTVGAAVYTSVAGCAQRIRAHTPTVADKVQTCWTFKASADQRRHSSQSRKRSKVTEGRRVVLIGTYVDVYRRIRSPLYTFIHGATCAMQWRRTGSRKHGHLRRLPAHTRAWSINPALVAQNASPESRRHTTRIPWHQQNTVYTNRVLFGLTTWYDR